ncbi:Fic family protein, partial [Rodentibacter myodis]
YSEVQKTKGNKAGGEPIYEEIPNTVDRTYAKVGDANANRQSKAAEEPIYSEVQKTKGNKAGSEPIYEEIPNTVDRTYAKVGDTDASRQSKAPEEPLYEEIPAVSAVKNKGKPVLPELPAIPQSSNTKADHTESDYAEIPAVSAVKNKGKPVLPELPAIPQSSNTKADHTESDYAEIPAVSAVKNKGRPVLPELPAVPQSANTKVNNAESDYAEIPALSAVENKAKRPLPEVPQSGNTKVNDVESDYAEIPAIQQGNANNNNSRMLEQVPTLAEGKPKADQSGSPSIFEKIKNFFKGHSKQENAEKQADKRTAETASNDPASHKPNYDNLEDNLNLKGLLELEAKRYDEFEQNVLNNSEFLAEARDAAKKSVPEAVLKQMAGTPELDDILTDGAKKTERKINEALHFKPTEQEFNDIQQLVKNLPKSDTLKGLQEQTQSIVDALADTSKTIQRSPELKDKLKGAVEEFLRNSQDGLTVENIEKLNHGLRPDEGENRVLYKKESLTKEDAIFSSPQASKLQLAQTIDFINQAKAQGVEPSVLAALAYQRLIAYHPFAEGNGRMARVIVNKLLLDAGYPAFTKFNSEFEQTIIPQTDSTKKSATSQDVVAEFLKMLGQKSIEDAKPKFVEVEKPSSSADENADLYAQIDPSKKKPKTESEEEKAARLAKEKDDLLGVKQSVPSEDNADYMTIKRSKSSVEATKESQTKGNNVESNDSAILAVSAVK